MLKIRGFTLLELMVALAIAAILLVGLLEIYIQSTQKTKEAVDLLRLQQTLNSSMQLLSNDIRRAGFWAGAQSDLGTGGNTNPFMTTDISVNAADDCLLLTYDRNGDGSLPSLGSGGDDERYGFRLLNNAIQSRPPGADFDCAASVNAWENITDPAVIRVTQLSFVLNQSAVDIDGSGTGTTTMTIRSVTVTMTAELVSDPSINKTLSTTIKIRNDKYAN